MRKLATIRRIDALNPIEGADAIECATVGGWKVVAQKGLYNVGDLAVYFEIDSWIPHELAPFLSKGKEPREFEGVKGERLRTIKLKKQISQGLLMPLSDELIQDSHGMNRVDLPYIEEGADFTEFLGILKWEKPINAQLAGICKGNFPTAIPKTDQERVQNLKKEVEQASAAGQLFEVTEKLEGSSMTCYLIDGVFGVCSRNLDLKETAENAFWKTAREEGIEEKMRSAVGDNIAVQGELIGPGIQGNIYKLSKPEFHVFDIYDIDAGAYLRPEFRRALVARMGLTHVPVISTTCQVTGTVDELLLWAEGESVLNDKQEREGIVFKCLDGGMSFKAISNAYLIKQKD